MDPDRDAFVARATNIVNLLLAVALAVTIGLVAWPKVVGGGASAAPPAPAYAAGQQTDTPAAWHQSAPHTLVLIAQAACGACQKAQPYLKTLVSRLDGRAAVVLASPGPRPEVEREYARAIGLPDTAVFPSPPGLRARVTPTLLLLDRDGTILGAWEGVGPEDRHAALTRAIDALLMDRPTQAARAGR